MRSLRVFWKWICSFTKTSWELEDYPIEMRLQREDQSHTAVPKYAARIINWWTIVGLGETEEEARHDLREALIEYAENRRLPRPGTRVPIQFACMDNISQFEDLATDFFPAILQLEFSECFVTDESSLMDFGGEWTNYVARVLLRYKVDISDLEPGNLVEVFERIEAGHESP